MCKAGMFCKGFSCVCFWSNDRGFRNKHSRTLAMLSHHCTNWPPHTLSIPILHILLLSSPVSVIPIIHLLVIMQHMFFWISFPVNWLRSLLMYLRTPHCPVQRIIPVQSKWSYSAELTSLVCLSSSIVCNECLFYRCGHKEAVFFQSHSAKAEVPYHALCLSIPSFLAVQGWCPHHIPLAKKHILPKA